MTAFRIIPLVLVAACVGEVGGGGSGGSGSGSGAVDAAVDAPKLMWIDAASGSGNMLPCKNPATPPGDGRHNPGKSCFQSCHNHGFSLAGTLYTNATGNSAFPGATITVIDNNNNTIEIVTQLNGNFWTSQPIAFPALVMASFCPSAVKMNTSVANGNCNQCHVGGTNNQMHLP
jgi:hypothetical protein